MVDFQGGLHDFARHEFFRFLFFSFSRDFILGKTFPQVREPRDTRDGGKKSWFLIVVHSWSSQWELDLTYHSTGFPRPHRHLHIPRDHVHPSREGYFPGISWCSGVGALHSRDGYWETGN